MQLTDKYTQSAGQVYLTGIQALVRLPLEQMRLDRAASLNTGCYITGYEGSPLGGYDFALQRSSDLLRELNIHFQPGMNEDLAATAIFGSQIFQILGARGPAKVDGVVGIWYGKGPGVDRSGDILRHANLCGTPGINAALILAGDDHPCKSSSIPHQSDFSLYNVNIPILFPGNTQEILDFGLYAIALSRHSGAYTSMKLLTQTCDGGGTIQLDSSKYKYTLPTGYTKHTDPRLVPGIALSLEHETNVRRIPAVLEFARLNPINRLEGSREARFGIATAGKYYYDVRQALSDLGADPDQFRIAKFGMTYPLEPGFVAEFAAGLDTIFVIEEKRSFLELQLREALYNSSHRPKVIGKYDAQGAPLLPPTAELDPDMIALALTAQAPGLAPNRSKSLAAIKERPRPNAILRTPSYCSGCPHNRSTIVLEGQVSGGGIGCHGMGFLMEDAGRGYSFATHMGGEGAPWFGMAPFVDRAHIFQNMGDGTFAHSGQLAIQAAVAAGVNITYRVLYNGHVAMTGGQDAVGALPIPALTKKLEAEGVRKIVVVTDDPGKYTDPGQLAMIATVRDRVDYEDVLRELETVKGVSVMLYDQECAAEKRRLRSRGKYEEPTRRLVIHDRVCENCGDCVTQSNCMSLQPTQTPYGEKMSIHQSSCNKDYTCALGDCPSFVSIQIKPGTGLRKAPLPAVKLPDLPPPSQIVRAGAGYRILMPGIGGTGVVTINALLATAALADGLSVLTLDQTGLAQKGGAVVSHLVLSEQPLAGSCKINSGNADLLLGFDLFGVLNPENLKCADPDRTAAVLNTHLTPTAASVRQRLSIGDAADHLRTIEQYTRRGYNVHLDASGISERQFGTHMMTNMLLLGAAWQSGLVPVSLASLEEAIRLNGVSVDRNLLAFHLGRQQYLDPKSSAPAESKSATAPGKPDYAAELTAYQNQSYAKEFQDFVANVPERFGDTVERNLFKLMMIKDEYEVARLLTDPSFRSQLDNQWEAVESVRFHLHPPLFRRLGLKRKLNLGSWFGILKHFKFLRGTPLDLFGYSTHRRRERSLIAWYKGIVAKAVERDDLDLTRLPEQIRGYESIKDASIDRVMKLAEERLKSGAPVSIQR